MSEKLGKFVSPLMFLVQSTFFPMHYLGMIRQKNTFTTKAAEPESDYHGWLFFLALGF